MIRSAVVALLVLAGLPAHADRNRPKRDNPSLVAARRAVEDVRYDDARRLLVEALKRGGSRTDQLREIYQLSAATAVVLGQNDLAEQYYRRVLALEPAAVLPADASPKLREPFVAAQAYMAAQSRLDARATRNGKGIEVVVTDPLTMVAAVAAIADGIMQPKVAYAGAPIVLEPSNNADEIAVLDEHGNYLRTVAVPAAITAELPPPPPPDDRPTPTADVPIVRRWYTWAVPAAALAATGIVFRIGASQAKDELDTIIAMDDMHFFDEAESERERYEAATILSNISFAVAGAAAVTAVVMAVTQPRASASVTATVSGDQAGVAIVGKF